MTAIFTTGRTDLTHLFDRSPILDGEDPHHPFLVFVAEGEDAIRVRIIPDAATLVELYPPETPVMWQWPGRWRSDFFQFTVADVAEALAARRRR